MYFITRPWFCQHFFAIIFILFDHDRFSRVCTAFFGAMEGTRTPGLLIRSQSLYPAELPTHTFRSEHDVFYH